MTAVIIEVPLRYGDESYGGEVDGKLKWNYKNEGKILVEIPPIVPPLPKDDIEHWLIDQYREDYLNG